MSEAKSVDAASELRLPQHVVLRDQVLALCSFMATCRQNNQSEWMEELCDRINEGLATVEDPGRVRWDAKADWIDYSAV